MEARFLHDFSQVRVHTDRPAAESAAEVAARAYTVGNHLVFRTGEYAPQTVAGRRSIAHELTHVVQQSRGAGTAPGCDAGSPLERAADHAADQVCSAGENPVQVIGASFPGLARQEDPDLDKLRKQIEGLERAAQDENLAPDVVAQLGLQRDEIANRMQAAGPAPVTDVQPVPPGQVAVEPDPVPITPVPDAETRVSELAAMPGRFNGLTQLAAFADALAAQYGQRVAQRTLTDPVRAAAEREARTRLNAEPRREGESAQDRARRISQEVRAAADAAISDVAQLRERYRQERLASLEKSWQQHVSTPKSQAMRAHTLANLWMVNRNQELLFQLSTMTYAPGAMQMWTHYKIMTAAQEAATPGGAAPADVDPSSVGGGPARHDPQLITTRAAEFLNDRHAHFANERWTTRRNHGSGGFGNRGLSVDMYLTKAQTIDIPGLPRGETFWARERVVELFRALDATATTTRFHFYALYNDFSVARAVNAFLTRGHVDFAGNIDSSGALNYHGGGEKLHVHIDLVPDELIQLTPAGQRLQPHPAAAQPAP